MKRVLIIFDYLDEKVSLAGSYNCVSVSSGTARAFLKRGGGAILISGSGPLSSKLLGAGALYILPYFCQIFGVGGGPGPYPSTGPELW